MTENTINFNIQSKKQAILKINVSRTLKSVNDHLFDKFRNKHFTRYTLENTKIILTVI